MGEEGRDCVIVRIECMVKDVPSFTPSKPIIGEVDHHLKQMNEKDFEPQMVSIGPIHHGKDHVKSMQQHKLRYLRQILGRRRRDQELSIEKCVLKLRNMEEKARLYYPKSINLDQDEFVEMMLLDGCFVIELLRSYWFEELRDENDQIFQSDHMFIQTRHDLVLLENQLPFFVLNELFDVTKTDDPEDDIFHLIHFLVHDMFPWPDFSKPEPRPCKLHNADHLLGLVYQSFFSFSITGNNDSQHKQSKLRMQTYSASEMKKAGIRLKGITPWDISFVNGVMKLPPLNMSDKSEALLRNLIAYELHFRDDQPKRVTDYAFFMHCLVRTTKDVETLRRRGIITNFLGSDEMICNMFNRLGKNVVISSDFCYSHVFESLNRYERIRHRKWMDKVKRNYFKKPWEMISFVGAALLLMLTFIQTLLFVLSYRKLSLLFTM